MLTLLRPRFWPGHLAMVLAAALAVGLGLWQFTAWKNHRSDAAAHLSTRAPVPLGSVMGGDSPFPAGALGRPVSFDGSWVGGNVYVSDRALDGRTGYWVVGVVKVDGTDSAIPVVEGWAAKPDALDLNGRTSVTGWLQASEGSGPFDNDPHDAIIPTMRIASLVEKYPVDLYSGYVVARSYTAAGPHPKPVTPESVPSISGFTALRNLFYALQWWVFGGFAVFIWWRWCADVLNPPDFDEAAGPAPDPEPGPVA